MNCSMSESNSKNGFTLSWCNISCLLKTISLVVIAWSLYNLANDGPHGGYRDPVVERGESSRAGPRQ